MSASVKKIATTIAVMAIAVTALSYAGYRWLGQHRSQATWAMIDSYCLDCHDSVERTAELALDGLEPNAIAEQPELFENVVRKLRGRMMPPPGAAIPDDQQYDQLVSFIETRLDEAARDRTAAGHVPLRRLNRTEYGNAVRDLLGIEVDVAELLPQDGSSAGFDNIAATLRESPTFVEQYVAAAGSIAAMAVGDPRAKFESAVYDAAGELHQQRHASRLPLGTRGGIVIDHFFPVDGEYQLAIDGLVLGDYTIGLEYRHTVVVLVDGVEVFRREVGGEVDMKQVDQRLADAQAELNAPFQNIRADITAGWHEVAVTFLARSFAESDATLLPFLAGGGDERIMAPRRLEIAGPIERSGLSRTPSRDRILICQPEIEADELPCATRILRRLARRAYRRPVTDEDLAGPLRFYEDGRAQGGFEEGIRTGIVAILASPKFLYRAEQSPEGALAGEAFTVDDIALASRLSFFLWSSIPDDELLETAEAGRLGDPNIQAAQVRRMLADPKAVALVNNFADQWLALREIDRFNPDAALFPGFDRELRDAFRTELTMFIESILLGDRSVLELLSADHTFVNERLALHYGLTDVQGSRFREVRLDDPNRHGLLGKPGILMITSYPNRTAPVLRGAWILEHLTGTPPAQPPPDVEALPETVAGEQAVTVRARLEAHRRNPSCNGCHGVLDPLGFALENFDAVGRWRDRDLDAGDDIDSSGVLADGTPVDSAHELSEALLGRPDLLVQTMIEKLMTFALGRHLDYNDMPTVRAIARSAAANDYRFADIVEKIVASESFRRQRVIATEAPPGG